MAAIALMMVLYASVAEYELFPFRKGSTSKTVLSIPVSHFIRKCINMKESMMILKIKKTKQNLTVLCLYCTGYKKCWYNEYGKTTKMTLDYFKDDFAIIENIIESTGVDKNEQYTFASMFTNLIEKVKDQYFPNESLADLYPNNDNDVRDGLRVILYMVLQLCIIAYSTHPEYELKEFWKAMTFHIQVEKQPRGGTKSLPLCVYGQVFRHMMTLIVGFQDEPVSNIINGYWKG
jgi:hypothetical protein